MGRRECRRGRAAVGSKSGGIGQVHAAAARHPRDDHQDSPHRRPTAIQRLVVRTLLMAAGVVGFLLAGTDPLVWASLTMAAVGFIRLMPPGTISMQQPGSPSGLLSLTLFAVGCFGSSSMITLPFTPTCHVPVAQAGVALGTASGEWAIASVSLTRWE